MTRGTESSVRLTRTFEAARAEVWRMWTDPAEFSAWYGPAGATVEVTRWDLQPGGDRHVSMGVDTPNGPVTMRFVGEFVEVTEPERLVYTEAMADQADLVTRVEVDLREHRGGTVLELTHHGIPAGSPGESGWATALDHLTTRLLPA